MASMSLREKVGQMVMTGIEGFEPGIDARTLIGEHKVGGVILFSRNIQSATQTAGLINRLQAMAVDQGGVPLLVAVDQEGGTVMRVPDATLVPGNMALGAARDAGLAYRVGLRIGEELRAMGFNVNFAPVLDVNNNPQNPVIGVRSFGEEPELVTELGLAMIRGLQDAGVLATAKHFPGHGDTAVDSHIDLPAVPHDRARLDQVELAPFRAAIENGVAGIMSAHVTFPAIDPTPGLPATLSKPVLTGLLREELGFEGLIFTDAMEMGAITSRYGIGRAAVMAVLAGADVVLVGWPSDWRMALEVVTALQEAAESGVIPEERIDASVARILAAKKRLGLFDAHQVAPASVAARVGGEKGDALALEAARKSVTLVKDEKGLVPLSTRRLLVVTPQVRGLTGIDNPGATETALGMALAGQGFEVEEVTVSLNPDPGERRAVVEKAQRAEVVLLGTYNAWQSRHAGQAQLARELLARGVDVIAVALRDPYDYAQMAEIPAYLATYGLTPPQLQALAEVLAGRTSPQGRLPVSIPEHFPAGSGITGQKPPQL